MTPVELVPALLLRRASERGDSPALSEKVAGRWQPTSWQDWKASIEAVARVLVAGGIAKGDRVLLFGPTSIAWATAELGLLEAGAVSVPLQVTATPEDIAPLVQECQARFAFVGGVSELEALTTSLGSDSSVEGIVVLGDGVPSEQGPFRELGLSLEGFSDAVRRGLGLESDEKVQRELEARRSALGPEDLATIAYSAGTTGSPRGAMLTHGSLAYEVGALLEAIRVGPDDRQLFFLPLAHIFGRIVLYASLAAGVPTSIAHGMREVMENIAEVRPTFFASGPLLFEKVFALTTNGVAREGRVKEHLWRWALGIALQASRAKQRGEEPSGLLAARLRYADRIALSTIKKRFGGRLRFAISGGAPLQKQLTEWFHAMGVLVLEGYGLTEMCGCTHVNREDGTRFGSVGKPLPGVDVRLGKDGEVLLRGPGTMRGYFEQPEATRQVIDESGWLHTGDIGELDDDGVLTIVDRKKDLIITAGGARVAPEHLERMLTSSRWIRHAVVIGDHERYLIALLTLDPATTRRWAAERRRGSDPAALARDPEMRALVQADIDRMNRRLSRHEQIRKFHVLDRDLSLTEGELTEAKKPRRDVIRTHFAPVIHTLYDASAPNHPPPSDSGSVG